MNIFENPKAWISNLQKIFKKNVHISKWIQNEAHYCSITNALDPYRIHSFWTLHLRNWHQLEPIVKYMPTNKKENKK